MPDPNEPFPGTDLHVSLKSLFGERFGDPATLKVPSLSYTHRVHDGRGVERVRSQSRPAPTSPGPPRPSPEVTGPRQPVSPGLR